MADTQYGWSIVDDVVVVVHGPSGAPSEESFAQYLATLDLVGNKIRAAIVHSGGGGPSALQRAQMQRYIDRLHDVPFVLVTESRLARGILTAVRWLVPRAGSHLAVFAPHRLDDALDRLALDIDKRRRVLHELQRLRRGAPLPRRS